MPAWAWLLLFFVAPVAMVVWFSFGYKPGICLALYYIGVTYAPDEVELVKWALRGAAIAQEIDDRSLIQGRVLELLRV